MSSFCAFPPIYRSCCKFPPKSLQKLLQFPNEKTNFKSGIIQFISQKLSSGEVDSIFLRWLIWQNYNFYSFVRICYANLAHQCFLQVTANIVWTIYIPQYSYRGASAERSCPWEVWLRNFRPFLASSSSCFVCLWLFVEKLKTTMNIAS